MRWLIPLCSLGLLMLLGCGGKSLRGAPAAVPDPVASEPAPQGAAEVPGMSELASLPPSPSRWISKGVSAINGSDTVAQDGDRNRVEGNALAIIPGGEDELAYAVYSQGGITADKPVSVQFTVSPTAIIPGGEDELAVEFWVGLSNYTRFSWEWLGPFNNSSLSSLPHGGSMVRKGTSAAFSLPLNSDELRERYVSRPDGFGECRFQYVVLVTATNNPDAPNGVKVETSDTAISGDYFTNKPHFVPVFDPFVDNGGEGTGMNRQGSTVTKRASSADAVLGWEHINSIDTGDERNSPFCYLVQRQAERSSTREVIGMIFRDDANFSFRDPPERGAPDDGYNVPGFPVPQPPVPGTRYTYSIKAYNEEAWDDGLNGNGATPSSRMRKIDMPIEAPEEIRADYFVDDLNPDTRGIWVKWSPVEGAVTYDIYARYEGQAQFLLGGGHTDPEGLHTVPALDEGRVIYYAVAARGADGVSPQSSEVRGFAPDDNDVAEFSIGNSTLRFRRVPGGSLQLGSPLGEDGRNDTNEESYQTLQMGEYYIMETEVTNAMWKDFVDANGYTMNQTVWTDGGFNWRNGNTITHPPYWVSGDFNGGSDDLTYPVLDVSWYEARAFANWVQDKYDNLSVPPFAGAAIDLPAEPEWEYAAEGPTQVGEYWLFPWCEMREIDGGLFNFGDDAIDLELCNSGLNLGPIDINFDGSSPVGSFKAGASWCGALDMAGNVAEWTSERFRTSYPSVWNEGVPTGGLPMAVRGGTFENTAEAMRTSHREQRDIDWRGGGIGGGAPDGIGVRLILVPVT